MTEKGKELYDIVKNKISRLSETDTQETKFADYWRVACNAKYKAHRLRVLYDDSCHEFLNKHRDEIKRIREDFVNNMDYYVEKCIERMRSTSHFRVYYAKTNEEAHNIFMNELGEEKQVFKSASNEAKDIGLLEFLRKNNIIIKQTAVGDILKELLDYKLPTYQLGPAVHLSLEDVIAKMKEIYKIDIESSGDAIVKYYRENVVPDIKENMRISLTSANAIAADDGSIFIGENTGNISLITRLAEKHITAVGITKINPTCFDAFLVAKTLARLNVTGMAYLSIISAPSNTSSVQGRTTFGAYGAKEVVVILVDEWRKQAVEKNLIYKDFLKCIACKNCCFVCSASRAFGNIYGSRYGVGPTAVIREYIHHGVEAAVEAGAFLCTGCENCSTLCPAGVNPAEIIKNIKKEATKKGLCPPIVNDYKQKILEQKNPFKNT